MLQLLAARSAKDVSAMNVSDGSDCGRRARLLNASRNRTAQAREQKQERPSTQANRSTNSLSGPMTCCVWLHQQLNRVLPSSASD